ncbi:23S rRNA (uracil(1939)-C(5))-methyltransferase RlmD [Halomonas alkalicola]|uniref:23S rRNA (uracil(1939)-C(5))-methyltransferase RlmD n=1 Tax=Halomonas alkalicola TaxID=1930622 RepID=A0ABY9H692_9GAMM|nr:23S rRNA (uracil(1939)-C(5))-methyltransferase RlmD [Halomonas alkalicola]WLI74001.1 23S rRNA (uracil(1939)-C(5))-methyltransferase RlmD [Halomonas alkalicola]
MAMLGKRRPRRERSGVSGLQGRQAPRGIPGEHAGSEEPSPGVTIERLAHDGRGLAHDAAGKALFVEGALPGERVEAAVHRTRKRFDEAHVRKVLEASSDRVAPPCAHFGRCGGCDLQHLAVPAQRRHKQAVLLDLLARQGIEAPAAPELLAGEASGYRRRARLGVKVDAEGQVHLGFRARHSHRLVDIDHCTILVPVLDALLAPLHQQVASLSAPRQVGHLELLDSDQGPALVVRQLKEHAQDREAWQAFAAEHGLHLAWLAGRESPALTWLTPAPALSCRVPAAPGAAGGVGELTLGFAPGDFLQANAEVNRQMVATALAWLEGLDGVSLLDLFAGVGNFSLPLASAGARVTAVEGSPAMVERLADNVRLNASARALSVTARQADLNDAVAVQPLLAEAAPDALLLDPPRDGADAVCGALVAAPVPRVLYVSCDPATLARDAARLVHGGYRLTRLAVADMFVHTSHLESMLLFEHPSAERQPQGATPDG